MLPLSWKALNWSAFIGVRLLNDNLYFRRLWYIRGFGLAEKQAKIGNKHLETKFQIWYKQCKVWNLRMSIFYLRVNLILKSQLNYYCLLIYIEFPEASHPTVRIFGICILFNPAAENTSNSISQVQLIISCILLV